ncbi:MAG: hypothetical protein ACTSXU_14750 [Promethearchaeota archaeon]
MTFTLSVTFQNTGGTDATADATLTYGGYTYLSSNNPAAVTVPAGGSISQSFTITVAAGATTSAVTIGATWTGTEAISGRALSGNDGGNTESVNIQSQASVAITSIQDTTAGTAYVEGMSFTIVVTFQNTGGTDATVDATLTYGGYTYLSSNDPAAVTVPAGGSITQSFTVTVQAGATGQIVTIGATWTGTEAISGRVLSGNDGGNTENVDIRSAVNAYVDEVLDTGSGTYNLGATFNVRVTLRNDGGVDAINVGVDLFFNVSGQLTYTNTTNNESLTIPAAGQLIVWFQCTVSLTATNNTWISLDASFSGNEQFSGDAISDSGANTPDEILISTFSPFSVSAVDSTGNPRYPRGGSLTVSVTLDNTGGLYDITTGNLTLSFNGTGFTSTPASYTGLSVAAGNSLVRTFTVDIGGAATLGSIQIDAHFVGQNNISQSIDEYASPPVVINVVLPASLAITDIVDVTGRGTYVEGESFLVRVDYSNTGGVDALNVDGVLDFNGYANIAQSNPAAVTVAAGGTSSQTFTVTVQSGVVAGTLNIDCDATGSEQYTARALSASSNTSLAVTIQTQANLAITAIVDVTGNGTYVEGESFIVRVDYSNTGGTDAINVDSILNFNGYSFLSSSDPAPVTVSAGGTNSQTFTVTVQSGATNALVNIDASATGSEQYTSRALSASSSSSLNVNIQSQAVLSITGISDATGRGYYIGGETFNVRVDLSNTGGTDAVSVVVTLDFGGYAGVSASSSSPITVAAGGTAFVIIPVTLASSVASGTLNINADAAGSEQYTSRALSASTSAPLSLSIYSQATLSITGIVDVTGRGVYVEGESFTIRVDYQNTGDTDVLNVDATLNFNGYANVISNDPAAITVPAASTASQLFTITLQSGVIAGSLTIDAAATGSENVTGRALSASSGTNDLDVNVQTQAGLQVVSIVDLNGNSTYIEGESFQVQVTYSNPGGTDALNVDGVLNFNGYANIAQSNPPAVTVAAGGTNTQTFIVTIQSGVSAGSLSIDVDATGAEQYTSRALSASSNTSLDVNIQTQSNLSISSIVDLTGHGTYVEGETFLVRVTYQNTGGTDALNVDGVLNFNGYANIAQDNPAAVTVAASGTQTQTFTVSVLAGVVSGTLDIDCDVSGTEEFSGRALTASTSSPVSVNIQSAAVLEVVSVEDWSGVGSYHYNDTFLIRVIVRNTGGTLIDNLSVSLSFGLATGLIPNMSSYNGTLGAGAQQIIIFNITVQDGASTGPIDTTGIATGDEQYTSRALSDSRQEISMFTIYGPPVFNIERITNLNTPPEPYARNMNFSVQVRLSNGGGQDVDNGTLHLFFNGSGYYAPDTFVTNISAGSWVVVDLNVSINSTATTGFILVDATFNGWTNDTQPVNETNALTPLQVEVKAPSNLQITAVSDFTGNGTYVRTETFDVQVTLRNYGGLDVENISLTLSFNGGAASGYTYPAVAQFTVAGGATVTRTISVAIGAGATNGTITITANAAGDEQVTGGSINVSSGSNNTQVQVQELSSLAIISIVDVTGRGVYVEGETFTVRVNYQNTGGTDVLGVDATLDFNGYTFLSSNNPAAVTVPAYGSASQVFTVTVSTGATNSLVTIDATASGSEQYTGSSINVVSGSNDLNVSIQGEALLAITTLQDRTLTPPYVGGTSTFVIRVNLQNNGGTDVTGATATLTYGGYTGLSSNSSAQVTVPAGGTAYIDFLVTVLASATTQVVTIDASASGSEEYTNDSLSDSTTNNDVDVSIQQRANLVITSINDTTGNGTYYPGEIFQVTVYYQNTGGTDVLATDATLDFGSYLNLTANNPVAVIVPAGGTASQVFTITVDDPAQESAVTIGADATGNENVTGRLITIWSTSNLTINIGGQAQLFVISITDLTGSAPYVAGQSFVVRVTYRNDGTTSVNDLDGTLSFSGVSSVTSDDPAAVNITSGGGVATQDFTVSLGTSANTGTLTISVSATGTDAGSGNPVNTASNATTDLSVNVQSQANVSISNIQDMTGTGTYVEGQSFTIRVTYQNTGGTDANNVDGTLTFAGYTFLSSDDPAPILVAAGASASQNFNVTVQAGATTQAVSIGATFTGSEAITSRALSGSSTTNETVNIQSHGNLQITGIVDVTGRGVYVEGETFTVRVDYSNTGGTDIQNVDALLDFNGYASLSSSDPAPVTVSASGTNSQTFTVTVQAGAVNALVTIDASASGSEQYTNLPVTALSGSNDLPVNIQSMASVAVTPVDVGVYVEGSVIVMTVTIDNTGGTDVLNGNLIAWATQGGSLASGISFANITNNSISVSAGASVNVSITLTINLGATTGAIRFWFDYTGSEQYTARSESDQAFLDVTVMSESDPVINSIADQPTTNATYSTGETMTIRVGFSKTGDADLYGNVIFVSNVSGVFGAGTTSAPIAYNILGTGTHDFSVPILPTAPEGNVEIWANWTGVVQGSGAAKSVEDSSIKINITIIADYLKITKVAGLEASSYIGNATYGPGAVGERIGVATRVAPGMTIVVEVIVNNTGTSLITLTSLNLTFWDDSDSLVTLFSGSYSNLSWSGVTSEREIAAGTSKTFNISVAVPASIPVGNYYMTAAIAGNDTLRSLQDDTVITEGTSLWRDYLQVVNTFLSVTGVSPISPNVNALNQTFIGTSDELIQLNYTILNEYFQALNVTIDSISFSLSSITYGSLATPASALISGNTNDSLMISFSINASALPGVVDLDVIVNGSIDGTGASSFTSTFTLHVQTYAQVFNWTVNINNAINSTLVHNGTYIASGDLLLIQVNASSGFEAMYYIRDTIGAFTQSATLGEVSPGTYESASIQAISSWTTGVLNVEVLLYPVGLPDKNSSTGIHVIYFDNAPPVVTSSTINGTAVSSGDNVTVAPQDSITVEFTISELGGVGLDEAYLTWAGGGNLTIPLVHVSGETYRVELSRQVAEIAIKWFAGKSPGKIEFSLVLNDTFGNTNDPAFAFTVFIKDTTVPTIAALELQDITGRVYQPNEQIFLEIDVPNPEGEVKVRVVRMYYRPWSNRDSGSIMDDTSAQYIDFVQVDDDTWIGTLPAQAGSTKLEIAFYIEDYAGNNNSASLDKADEPMVFAMDTSPIEVSLGYVFLGLIFFGIIFSISYRIQVSRVIKKAKKVPVSKKKVAGKGVPGEGKKKPISKDIPTKICPICKAKIGADLDECPYCHKKFN